VAVALAAAGADVACAARATDATPLPLPGTIDDTVRRASAAGRGRAIAVPTNLAKEDEVVAMIARTVEEFGRLDILVNNAGISRDATIWKMTEQDWDSVIAVHLKGTFAPTHHAVKHWKKLFDAGEDVSSGRVINTTSGAGLVGNFGQANYTAAKAGIAAFTQTVSLETFKMGVTVNCIGPAGATRMAASIPGAGIEAKEPDEFTEWNRMDPSLGSPVVAWLASDKAGHVTGQIIRVVGDEIVLMNGWSNGNSVSQGEKRWEAEKLTQVMNTDIFKTRTPGLRY